MRLMIDTNVALDFMLAREPYFADARKLLLLGYMKEIELWIRGAQVNDLFYVLTKGGKPAYNAAAKVSLRKLRECIHVYRVGEQEIDAALISNWTDLEDACLYQAALNMKAGFIITRNQQDFSLSSIKALDATEFFKYLEEHKSMMYAAFELDNA